MHSVCPGSDLRQGLQQFVSERKIAAAVVIACVGCLRQLRLRFAGEQEVFAAEGKYEIVSLQAKFFCGDEVVPHAKTKD